jgi:molybdopterin-binding protein
MFYMDTQIGGAIMKISARNMLKGKIKQIKPGVVNTEVIIDLPGGAQVVSVVTKESAENLGLAVGKQVYAVIKASNVMIAVD